MSLEREEKHGIIFFLCLFVMFLCFVLGWTLNGYMIYSGMFKNTVQITEMKK